MEKKAFGKTGLMVTPLGFGAGHIGSQDIDEKEIGNLLNSVLDLGINVIDTARAYGLSEERIGRHLSYRRKDYVLSTKVGYGIPGYQDWTYEIILAGIDEALKLLKTEYIDIVHLHSCPIETLQKGDVIYALEKAKEEGKLISAAYSGENEALHFAVGTERFDSIQTSINVTDQRNIDHLLPKTMLKELGVIAKRPAANAFWRYDDHPYGNYAEVYWIRAREMDLNYNKDWLSTALRFTVFTEGVHTSIVGTNNLDHLKENIKAIEKGPLQDDEYDFIRNSFKQKDSDWIGQV